jgi:small subunit ribosomal protein S17
MTNKIKSQAKGLSGKVISTKMNKTAVVEVSTLTRHPLYKKAVRTTKHYSAQNDITDLAVGDYVRIRETKPISKTKHFMIVEKVVR